MNVNVEILRKAARLMRERAEKAAPSPWREWTVDPRPRRQVGPSEARPVAEVYERSEASTNAEHIASWHPDVALAVAAWIDSHAADLASADGNRLQTDSPGDVDMALKVARAYLAGEWS